MQTPIGNASNLITRVPKLNIVPVKQASTSNHGAARHGLSGDWSKLSNVLKRSAGGCSKSRAR